MKLDFSNKTVLVVGGSSGIGNGIAQAFRSSGADVHAWGTRRSASDYSEDGSDLDGLRYKQVDVANEKAVADVDPGFAALDVLVLCQGLVRYGREEFEMSTFRNVLDVNLVSIMACANRFHGMLAQSRGALITVSSVAAFHAAKGNPAYSASKAGTVALTRSLADAYARDGIRVNGIAPGLVDTKLTKVTTANPKRLEATLNRIPARRIGTPEDMAGVALFLASPLAAYVVGQTIIVDGGLLLA
jgi:3-oxoacyl-[acyl-carrier protein] reductase